MNFLIMMSGVALVLMAKWVIKGTKAEGEWYLSYYWSGAFVFIAGLFLTVTQGL